MVSVVGCGRHRNGSRFPHLRMSVPSAKTLNPNMLGGEAKLGFCSPAIHGLRSLNPRLLIITLRMQHFSWVCVLVSFVLLSMTSCRLCLSGRELEYVGISARRSPKVLNRKGKELRHLLYKLRPQNGSDFHGSCQFPISEEDSRRSVTERR